MRADRIMLGLHGIGIVLALTTALVWPRAGQAAVLVPLGGDGLARTLRWADREQAELIALDTATGRVLARIASHRSLLSAIASGIVPIATRAAGCTTRETQ